MFQIIDLRKSPDLRSGCLLEAQEQEQEDLEQDRVLGPGMAAYNPCRHYLSPKKLVGWVTRVWWQDVKEEEEQAPVFVEGRQLEESGGSECVWDVLYIVCSLF